VELVDTHCHIQSAGLSQGERTTRELWAKAGDLTPGVILESAKSSGVTKLLCVGCDLKDSQLATEFAQNHDGCFASIGIHPHEAKDFANQTEVLKEFAALAAQPKVVAVGECGFDFFYNHSPKADQTSVLKFQIELALGHELPLIFHVREAFDDFWPLFDSYSGIRGVLHSFTDSEANMQKAIDRGLFIGVNGIATFAKQAEQLEVYRAIPLSNLLLETDAPFLTPTPYRGTINQPKNVLRVAEFLAELRGEQLPAISEATTNNARELFKI
jgi:TatD DNase family protein